MNPALETTYIAFDADRRIASGDLLKVARSAKMVRDRRPDAPVLIFDDATSAPLELDFRGSVEEVLQRLSGAANGGTAHETASPDATAAARGPGRPKLGVVAREITLLPRHWEWLAQQPGGASVTIRKLVEEARRAHAGSDRLRLAQEAAYRFMSVMAGNKPHYEEAIRALFASDAMAFKGWIGGWPDDIRGHALELAGRAFDLKSKSADPAVV
jgi:hypothetical protein